MESKRTVGTKEETRFKDWEEKTQKEKVPHIRGKAREEVHRR